MEHNSKDGNNDEEKLSSSLEEFDAEHYPMRMGENMKSFYGGMLALIGKIFDGLRQSPSVGLISQRLRGQISTKSNRNQQMGRLRLGRPTSGSRFDLFVPN